MHSDLSRLKITFKDLETITGLEISETFMGRTYRPSLFRHRDRLLSFLLTELLTLGLILIFCLPIALILARSIGGSHETTFRFLLIGNGVSIGLFAGWNGWMRHKSQQMKTLAHLLDEVDKHHEILQAVHILDELETVQSAASQQPQFSIARLDREEILLALTATRESLVSALMTERVLRKHQSFMARRQELFSTIETNLATLRTLQVNHEADEFSELLNEALRIGLSVQRETEKFMR